MAQRVLMAAALLDDFREDAADEDVAHVSALVENLRRLAQKYDGRAVSRQKDGRGLAAILAIAQSMETEEIYEKLEKRSFLAKKRGR